MTAAEFIAKKEGFSPVAIWDVNAWRIGYGSDTHTTPQGVVIRVQQGDETTKEAAQRDLQRRLTQEFAPKIMAKVGAQTYQALPEPVKIALLSFAYNYGNITKSAIVNAVKAGNLNELARVWIESTYHDNKRLPESMRNALRKRRAEEAALIQSAAEKKNES